MNAACSNTKDGNEKDAKDGSADTIITTMVKAALRPILARAANSMVLTAPAQALPAVVLVDWAARVVQALPDSLDSPEELPAARPQSQSRHQKVVPVTRARLPRTLRPTLSVMMKHLNAAVDQT